MKNQLLILSFTFLHNNLQSESGFFLRQYFNTFTELLLETVNYKVHKYKSNVEFCKITHVIRHIFEIASLANSDWNRIPRHIIVHIIEEIQCSA